jgi:hypothetical protein
MAALQERYPLRFAEDGDRLDGWRDLVIRADQARSVWKEARPAVGQEEKLKRHTENSTRAPEAPLRRRGRRPGLRNAAITTIERAIDDPSRPEVTLEGLLNDGKLEGWASRLGFKRKTFTEALKKVKEKRQADLPSNN